VGPFTVVPCEFSKQKFDSHPEQTQPDKFINRVDIYRRQKYKFHGLVNTFWPCSRVFPLGLFRVGPFKNPRHWWVFKSYQGNRKQPIFFSSFTGTFLDDMVFFIAPAILDFFLKGLGVENLFEPQSNINSRHHVGIWQWA